MKGSAADSQGPAKGGYSAAEDMPRGAGKLKASSNQAFTSEPERPKNGPDEPNGFIGHRELLAYHPKTGR